MIRCLNDSDHLKSCKHKWNYCTSVKWILLYQYRWFWYVSVSWETLRWGAERTIGPLDPVASGISAKSEPRMTLAQSLESFSPTNYWLVPVARFETLSSIELLGLAPSEEACGDLGFARRISTAQMEWVCRGFQAHVQFGIQYGMPCNATCMLKDHSIDRYASVLEYHRCISLLCGLSRLAGCQETVDLAHQL